MAVGCWASAVSHGEMVLKGHQSLNGDVGNAHCSISNACVSFVFNVSRDVQAGVSAVFGGGVKNIGYEKVET